MTLDGLLNLSFPICKVGDNGSLRLLGLLKGLRDVIDLRTWHRASI